MKHCLVRFQVSRVTLSLESEYPLLICKKQIQCFLGSKDEDNSSFSASPWMFMF